MREATEAARRGRWTRSTGRGVAVQCPTGHRCDHVIVVESGGVTRSYRTALLAMKDHLDSGCPGVEALAAE